MIDRSIRRAVAGVLALAALGAPAGRARAEAPDEASARRAFFLAGELVWPDLHLGFDDRIDDPQLALHWPIHLGLAYVEGRAGVATPSFVAATLFGEPMVRFVGDGRMPLVGGGLGARLVAARADWPGLVLEAGGAADADGARAFFGGGLAIGAGYATVGIVYRRVVGEGGRPHDFSLDVTIPVPLSRGFRTRAWR